VDLSYSSTKHRDDAEAVVTGAQAMQRMMSMVGTARVTVTASTAATMIRSLVLGFIAACAMAACTADSQRLQQSAATTQRFEFSRIVMGAPCRVVFYAPSEESANESASAVFTRLAAIEEALSDWIPSSETRQLPSEANVTVTVSAELAAALETSLNYARMTDGAFDPTIGALTKRWRTARRDGIVPTSSETKELLARCGWQKIQFDESTLKYTALVPGLELDFGGIGQGIAADAALAVLRRCGISCALIDLSGDIAVSDAPPGSSGWNIDLDDPWHTRLQLANAAVTTSGDRFQHMDVASHETQATRLSHIIRPDTGQPLANRVEVVVIARTGVEADALATAFSVMGPERGRVLLAQLRECSARWRFDTPSDSVVASDDWPHPALSTHASPGIATF
jgi:thiamine biosynthesis lipoprotein